METELAPQAAGMDLQNVLPPEIYNEMADLIRQFSAEKQRILAARAVHGCTSYVPILETARWITYASGDMRDLQIRKGRKRIRNWITRDKAFRKAWQRLRDGIRMSEVSDMAIGLRESLKPQSALAYQEIIDIPVTKPDGTYEDPNLIAIKHRAASEILYGKHSPRPSQSIGTQINKISQTNVLNYTAIMEQVKERRRELLSEGEVVEAEVVDDTNS